MTDGYALALALEGEGMRIEKEIGATVAADDRPIDSERLDVLAERLEATNGDVRALRANLASLRVRTEAVRASALAARS